jgi:hypothetical protein
MVITDPLNQKMEHQIIQWENLSFLANWVIDTPRVLVPRSITSANIQESSSSTIISFPTPQCSYLKDDCPYVSSISTPPLCFHPSLQPLASSLGQVSYSIQCLDCAKLVTLSTLPTQTENEQIHLEHRHHNPRTNIPPTCSTSKDPCPHPQCSDFPFPHEPHILVITEYYPLDISQRYVVNNITNDIKRLMVVEITKFLSLMSRC